MPDSLDAWLAHIERQHPASIALGLDRVLQVKHALAQRQSCPLIIVGGTNGKGSTCAMLEAILCRAGYRVGLYTSPHLLHYNERVRVNGAPVEDEPLCQAFARVEHARGAIPLTYFEFGTLAAWEVFAGNPLDVVILEVGLGGRLDAVNVYEPDCSIVVGVDIDHTNFLGTTREQIGFEKAGIFRPAKPAICGDANPPRALLDHAAEVAADLKLIGRDFGFRPQEQQWQYIGWNGQRGGLAHPALRGVHQLINASCALAALDSLHQVLPVAMQDIRRGLLELVLPGRFQVLPGRPAVVLDVAHNPQAAAILAENLAGMAFYPETWAIFGVMQDKDIAGIIAALKGRVTRWLPCDLDSPRGASRSRIHELLTAAGASHVEAGFPSAAAAYAHAREHASDNDRIVTFGSFLTVADVMRALGRQVQ